MKEIKPPSKMVASTFSIFLAGSIEMGTASSWQDEVVKALESINGIVLNPRRDSWDSTWIQEEGNGIFNEQVTWELAGILDTANLVVFYFDPNTKAPVTMLELGLTLASHKECLVCCPKGFWRKGNIDITCKRFGVPVIETLESLISHIIEKGNNHVHYQS
jgi:hypothetical protein